MAAGDLVTLEQAKEWLAIEPSEPAMDKTIQRLITSESSRFKALTRRDLLLRSYTETRDGQGTTGISPRQFPIVSVSSVVVDGQTIDARTSATAGWVITGDRIEIAEPLGSLAATTPFAPFPPYSPAFTIGRANVVLTYRAGFRATDVATSASTGVQTAEAFYSDEGVTYAGNALTKVTGTPTTGQYAVNSTGLYTFAAADDGHTVSISYAYVPADVQQAVLEMIGWQFRARDRIGQTSKSIGGETVAFSQADVPPSAQIVIDTYKRWDL